MADCLETGYTECWCNCVLSVVNQYCSAAAILTGCQCTNLNYRTPMLACVQSSNCVSVSEDISIAEEVCSLAGYSLALPPNFALSTSAVGGSIALSTASASAGGTGLNGGSAGFTTSINTGASGQGYAASRSSLQPGAIAGIVIGSIAVLVIAIIGIILILQRRLRNKAVAVSYRDQYWR
jgi:hypothetical protein